MFGKDRTTTAATTSTTSMSTPTTVPIHLTIEEEHTAHVRENDTNADMIA